jgi:molybdopterin synthase catalytic subunit
MTVIIKDRYKLKITENALEISEGYEFCVTSQTGAVVVFTGLVRDHNEISSNIDLIDYQIWESKALQILEELSDITLSKFEDLQKIFISHRYGNIALSEESIVIVVTASHRKMAFVAAEFLIDTIKKTLPIWKNEYSKGTLQPSSDITPITPLYNFK